MSDDPLAVLNHTLVLGKDAPRYGWADRMVALNIAAKAVSDTPEQVVERAKVYADFIFGPKA